MMRKTFLVVLVLLAAATAAQVTSSIVGTVTDGEGAAFPGVTVTITSPSLQGTRTTITDETGSYRFDGLPPGEYKIRAELSGFAIVERTVRASIAGSARADIAFRVASGVKPAFTIVRVHYGTNRTPITSKRTRFDYNAEPATLNFGSATVSIPRDHRIGDWEKPLLEMFETQDEHVMLIDVAPAAANEFAKGVQDRVGRSKKKEAFVFVHGFNTSFQDAITRTALLAYDLEFDGAPIAFAWPSRAVTKEYPADEESAQASIEPLETFLQLVAAQSGAQRIHLIAHSMGNRVLLEALRSLQQRNLQPKNLQHLILTAPDVNVVRFHQLMPHLVSVAGRATLYASSRDRALKVSRDFHDYPRAGEAGKKLPLLAGVDSVDVSAVDTSLIGHSYYGDNTSVIADLRDLIRNDTPPAKRACLTRHVRKTLPFWVFRRCGSARAH
jgi:esterase/lipase superfamily enzyme